MDAQDIEFDLAEALQRLFQSRMVRNAGAQKHAQRGRQFRFARRGGRLRILRVARAGAAARATPQLIPETDNDRGKQGENTVGKPGNNANSTNTPLTINNAQGCPTNCLNNWVARFSFSVPWIRVTIKPAAIEIKSAGICAIKPSPTDRIA